MVGGHAAFHLFFPETEWRKRKASRRGAEEEEEEEDDDSGEEMKALRERQREELSKVASRCPLSLSWVFLGTDTLAPELFMLKGSRLKSTLVRACEEFLFFPGNSVAVLAGTPGLRAALGRYCLY